MLVFAHDLTGLRGLVASPADPTVPAVAFVPPAPAKFRVLAGTSQPFHTKPHFPGTVIVQRARLTPAMDLFPTPTTSRLPARSRRWARLGDAWLEASIEHSTTKSDLLRPRALPSRRRRARHSTRAPRALDCALARPGPTYAVRRHRAGRLRDRPHRERARRRRAARGRAAGPRRAGASRGAGADPQAGRRRVRAARIADPGHRARARGRAGRRRCRRRRRDHVHGADPHDSDHASASYHHRASADDDRGGHYDRPDDDGAAADDHDDHDDDGDHETATTTTAPTTTAPPPARSPSRSPAAPGAPARARAEQAPRKRAPSKKSSSGQSSAAKKKSSAGSSAAGGAAPGAPTLSLHDLLPGPDAAEHAAAPRVRREPRRGGRSLACGLGPDARSDPGAGSAGSGPRDGQHALRPRVAAPGRGRELEPGRCGALDPRREAGFLARAVALSNYYDAVGLTALVPGLDWAKPGLQQKILDDSRVNVYPGGRSDIAAGRVNVRVLATVEYLAQTFHEVTISCLITGHRLYARPGTLASRSVTGLARTRVTPNALTTAGVTSVPRRGGARPVREPGQAPSTGSAPASSSSARSSTSSTARSRAPAGSRRRSAPSSTRRPTASARARCSPRSRSSSRAHGNDIAVVVHGRRRSPARSSCRTCARRPRRSACAATSASARAPSASS